MPREYTLLVTLIAVIVTLITSSFTQNKTPPADAKARQQEQQTHVLSAQTTATTSAYVQRVVDGDTIRVVIASEEATVRLIGIDTPESVDPRRPVECLGKEASNRLKELIENKFVRLEGDSSQQDRDRYNRLLRYVFLDSVHINKQLIVEGFANEYTYDLPYIYQHEFKIAQKEAEASRRGLWNPQLCVQNQNSSLQ